MISPIILVAILVVVVESSSVLTSSTVNRSWRENIILGALDPRRLNLLLVFDDWRTSSRSMMVVFFWCLRCRLLLWCLVLRTLEDTTDATLALVSLLTVMVGKNNLNNSGFVLMKEYEKV